MIENLKNVYKTCFNDTDKYTDFVFKNKYNENNALYHIIDGQIVSELFIVEKKIVINNKIIACPYICGVCTLPQYRNFGYAHMLMKRCFDVLLSKGFAVCALHPFKHSFYEKYGFVTCTKVKNYKVQFTGNQNIKLKNIEKKDILLIKELYDNFFKDRSGYVYRGYDETLYRFLEMQSSGYCSFILQDGKIAGYAYYDDNEIEEYCAKPEIINYIEEFDKKTVHLPSECNFGLTEDFTMIKLLDRTNFLKSLNIKDSILKPLDDFSLLHAVLGSYAEFEIELPKEVKNKYCKLSNYVFDKY